MKTNYNNGKREREYLRYDIGYKLDSPFKCKLVITCRKMTQRRLIKIHMRKFHKKIYKEYKKGEVVNP